MNLHVKRLSAKKVFPGRKLFNARWSGDIRCRPITKAMLDLFTVKPTSVPVSGYYILRVFRNLLLLPKYYLDVSLQAGLVTDLFPKCDGELSRFFPATSCEEQRHFRVNVFASISKRILITNLILLQSKPLFKRNCSHQEFV